MKKIIIILFINIFFVSCLDLIINDEFYESIHLQGSGWIDFYQNNPATNRIFNNDYSAQIWFSGQDTISESAGCILNIYDNDIDISIYRNPNISNQLMIYVNGALFEEVEIDNLNLDDKNNFVLLSLVKEQDYIRLYINDMFILNECIVPIESANQCAIDEYNWNELTNHCTYATSSSSACLNAGECSNTAYNNEEAYCVNAGGCSNTAYNNEESCIDAEVCSNTAYDNEEACIDAGECTNIIYNNELDCVNAGEIWSNIWASENNIWTSENNTWDSSNLIWDSKINLQLENAQISIGSAGNSNNDPANFWGGYIDEIRIWDIALSNENILFHNQYPDKIVESYDSLEFNHINGIWDFKINTSEENIPYKFQDINDNNEFVIIYNQGGQDNNLSKIGR